MIPETISTAFSSIKRFIFSESVTRPAKTAPAACATDALVSHVASLQLTEAYSPPKGWIADWIANPEPLRRTITNALGKTILPNEVVSLCTDYLQIDLESTENDNIFGARKWKEIGCTVEPAPKLPLSFEAIWQGLCPGYTDKRVREICYLYYRPKVVNGQPMTPNEIEKVAQNAPEGKYKSQINYFEEGALTSLANTSIDEPGWALLPLSIIEESKKKSFKNQLKSGKEGWELPSMLDVIIAMFTRYIWSGQELYKGNPAAHLRCRKQLQFTHLIVGGMYSRGLRVDHSTMCIGNSYDVAPFRKISLPD